MKNQQRIVIFGGIILAAIVVAGVFIAVSTRNSQVKGSRFDYDSIPQSRTEDGAFVLGNPEAPITVVEFADFLCPHCQEYTETMEQVIENHVVTGQAKVEYRFFPTVDRSAFTARLAECAVEQDPDIFWPAHDTLYDLAKRGWNQTSSQEFAKRLNLNYGNLLNCIESADQFRIDQQVGVGAGVSGTPAIRIRLGNGPLQPINEANRGGPPYQIIAAAIQAVQ